MPSRKKRKTDHATMVDDLPKRKAMAKFRDDAWIKEFRIKHSDGPHSISERWYPKEIIVPLTEKEKK